MARLPYYEVGSGNAEADAFLEESARRMEEHGLEPKLSNFMKEYANFPEFTSRFLHMLAYFHGDDAPLPRRTVELVHMAVMDRFKGEYGFTFHTMAALTAGLTRDQLRDIGNYKQSPAFDDADKAILRHTDELLTNGKVSEESFREVVALLGEEGSFYLAASIANSAMRTFLAGWCELDLDQYVLDELTAEDPELVPELRSHFHQ